MAGGMLLNQPIALATIRKAGKRLGYRGRGLDHFVALIAAIDAHDRSENFQRQASEIAAAAKKK